WEHGLAICEQLLGWLLTVLAVAGSVALVLRKVSAPQKTYLLLNLAFFLVLLPIHLEIRYPLFMLGGLLALSSCGLFLWKLRPQSPLRAGAFLALLVPLVYMGFKSYEINRRQISLGPTELLTIAEQFRANVPASSRGTYVAARKPHVAYYT